MMPILERLLVKITRDYFFMA